MASQTRNVFGTFEKRAPDFMATYFYHGYKALVILLAFCPWTHFYLSRKRIFCHIAENRLGGARLKAGFHWRRRRNRSRKSADNLVFTGVISVGVISGIGRKWNRSDSAFTTPIFGFL